MAPKKQPKKAPPSSPKKSNNDNQDQDHDATKPATPTSASKTPLPVSRPESTPTSASGSKSPTAPKSKPSQQQDSQEETPATPTPAQPRSEPQPNPEHIHRPSIPLPPQPPSSPLAQPTTQTPPSGTTQPSSPTTHSPPANGGSTSRRRPDIKIKPATPDPAKSAKEENKWPWKTNNPALWNRGNLSPAETEKPVNPFGEPLNPTSQKEEGGGSELKGEEVSPIDDEPSGGERTGVGGDVVSPIEPSANKGVGVPSPSPDKEDSPHEATSAENKTASPTPTTQEDDLTTVERGLAHSYKNAKELKSLSWDQQPPLDVLAAQGGGNRVRGKTSGHQSIPPRPDPSNEEDGGNGDDDSMQDEDLGAGAELQRSSQIPIGDVMQNIRGAAPAPTEPLEPASPRDNPLERQDARPISWNIGAPRQQRNVSFFEPATAFPLSPRSVAPVMNLRGANTDSEAEPAPTREQLREWADAEDRENADYRRRAQGEPLNLQGWPPVQPSPLNTRAGLKFEPAYTPNINYPPKDGQLAPKMDSGNVNSLLAQFKAEQERQAQAVRRMKEDEQPDSSSPVGYHGDPAPDDPDDFDESDDPHDGSGDGVGRGEASRHSSSSAVSFGSDFKKPTNDPSRSSVIEPPSNTTINYPGNRPLAAVVGDAEAANFPLRQQWLGIWPGQDESTRDLAKSEEKEKLKDNLGKTTSEGRNIPAPASQTAPPRSVPPLNQQQYETRAGAIPLDPPRMLPQAFRDFEQLVNQNLDESWAKLADQALSSARALFSNHQSEAITHRLASAEAAHLVSQIDEVNTELTREMERQRAELDESIQRLQEANTAYRDCERRNGIANQEIRDLRVQVEKLRAQPAAATALNTSSENQTQDVNRQLAHLQTTHETEKANLQGQIDASRQAARDARTQIKKLTHKWKEERSSTDDGARDSYIDQLKNDTTKTCESKLEELHEMLITATTDAAINKAALEANIEELKEHVQEGMLTEDECEKRNKEAAKKIAELEQRLKVSEADLFRTREELDQVRNREDQDTTINTSPDPSADDQFDETHSKLVEELRQILNRSNIMVIGQHDQLYRNGFHPIIQGVEQLATNHQQLATQVTTLTAQVAKLTQERNSLQANSSPARNQELTKRVTELEAQLKNCQKEQIYNRGIITGQDIKIQRLTENRETDKKTMKDDDQTLRNLQQTLTESVDTVESLTHALEDCRSEHDDMDKERGKLRKDIEKLEKQNKQLRDAVNRGSGPVSVPQPGRGREQQTPEDERPTTPGVPSVNGFEFAMARARHALGIMRRERASNDAHPPDDIEMGIRAVEEAVQIAEELPEESSVPLRARAQLEAGIVHYYANDISEAGTHFLSAERLANHLSEDDEALLSQWREWIADGNTVEIRREGYMSEEQREYERRRRHFRSSSNTPDRAQKQRHEGKETSTRSKKSRPKDELSTNKRPRTKHARNSPPTNRYKKRSKGKDRRGRERATDLEPADLEPQLEPELEP